MDRRFRGLGAMQYPQGPLVGRNRFIAPIGRAPAPTFEFTHKRLRQAAQ
jgi:hypothetical protein